MQNFINNWSALVSLSAGVTSLDVALPDGEYALTLSDSLGLDATRWEIVAADVVSGVATLTRGQEGTADQSWPSGSYIYMAVTAAFLEYIQTLVGADGASAYEIAVSNGFVGTEAEWLASLQGNQGDAGADGASAYEIAVANGFVGNEAEWLASLEGDQGDAGADGASAYEVAVANGFVGTEVEWLASLVGADGAGLTVIDELPSSEDLPATGNPGDGYLIAGDLWLWVDGAWLNAGPIQGPAGASAYEVAVASGFVGTQVEWLASLVGDQGDVGPAGPSAYEVAVANGFVGTEADWLASLEGDQGDAGPDGDSAYEVAVANGFVGTEAEWLASLVGEPGPPAEITGLPFRNVTASGAVTPADAGHWLICDSATPITLTIGAEATASWAIPDLLPMFHILQVGAGSVTVTGDGFSVVVRSVDTNVLGGAGSAATALRRGSNVWSLFGGLVAA